jgi:hypothetical protein
MLTRQPTSGRAVVDRRRLLKGAVLGGLGLAAARCAGSGQHAQPAGGLANPASPAHNASGGSPAGAAPAGADSVQMIFTGALIAEDLATTFYYHGLTGEVIQDLALAGPQGSATDVSGSLGNVGYLRAALAEEIGHADLMRQLIGRAGAAGAAGDPVQTFYFPAGSFDDITTFLSTLDALESAFIGAYLAAVRELSSMAARLAPLDSPQLDPSGNAYTPAQLVYFTEVAAAIMGVEAEHRAMGRVIGRVIPATDLCYEQRAGVHNVYSGTGSAVAALQPFVKPGAKDFDPRGHSLQAARRGAKAVMLPCKGGLPA